MINVIVASHGAVAKAMLESAVMAYGDFSHCFAITLSEETGIEGFKCEFAQVLSAASNGADGVLVLCDMQGGTPWNVACRYAFDSHTKPPVAVLGGVNFPMLLQTDDIRDLTEVNVAAAQLLDFARLTLVLAAPAEITQSDDF